MLLKSVSFKKMKLIYCDALLIHLAYSKKAHRTHQQTIEILHCSLRVCSNYRLRENQSQGWIFKKNKKKKKNKKLKGGVNCSGIKETFNAFVRTPNICCVIPCIA